MYILCIQYDSCVYTTVYKYISNMVIFYIEEAIYSGDEEHGLCRQTEFESWL